MNSFQVYFEPGYLHRIGSIAAEPTSELTEWSLFQVRHANGTSARHLVGCSNAIGRFTTAVVAIDLKQMQATTKSGRVYQLMGPTGADPDGMWIYRQWLRVGKRLQEKDLTEALMRLRRLRGLS